MFREREESCKESIANLLRGKVPEKGIFVKLYRTFRKSLQINGSLAIRDKIARGLINRKIFPRSLKNEKLFPDGFLGNNVICSPLVMGLRP